jgi:hypothetical protein
MRVLSGHSRAPCVGRRWRASHQPSYCPTVHSAVSPRRSPRLERRATGESDPSEPKPSDAAVSMSNLRFRKEQQDIPVVYVDEFPAELEGGPGGADMPCVPVCLLRCGALCLSVITVFEHAHRK